MRFLISANLANFHYFANLHHFILGFRIIIYLILLCNLKWEHFRKDFSFLRIILASWNRFGWYFRLERYFRFKRDFRLEVYFRLEYLLGKARWIVRAGFRCWSWLFRLHWLEYLRLRWLDCFRRDLRILVCSFFYFCLFIFIICFFFFWNFFFVFKYNQKRN